MSTGDEWSHLCSGGHSDSLCRCWKEFVGFALSQAAIHTSFCKSLKSQEIWDADKAKGPVMTWVKIQTCSLTGKLPFQIYCYQRSIHKWLMMATSRQRLLKMNRKSGCWRSKKRDVKRCDDVEERAAGVYSWTAVRVDPLSVQHSFINLVPMLLFFTFPIIKEFWKNIPWFPQKY